MEVTVPESGLVLPRRMLKRGQRVTIQKKRGVITITPQEPVADPLMTLGSSPSKQNLRTESIKHDTVVYRGK